MCSIFLEFKANCLIEELVIYGGSVKAAKKKRWRCRNIDSFHPNTCTNKLTSCQWTMTRSPILWMNMLREQRVYPTKTFTHIRLDSHLLTRTHTQPIRLLLYKIVQCLTYSLFAFDVCIKKKLEINLKSETITLFMSFINCDSAMSMNSSHFNSFNSTLSNW